MRPATFYCAAAIVALAGCATDYDPYRTANPPNPDPMPSTSLPAQGAIAAAPAAGAAVVAPVAPATVMVVPAAATYRPGRGTVQGVQAVQAAVPPSASAGATAAPVATYHRLTLRMEDGTTQVVDQTNASFRVGDRVQLTPDGRIVRG